MHMTAIAAVTHCRDDSGRKNKERAVSGNSKFAMCRTDSIPASRMR